MHQKSKVWSGNFVVFLVTLASIAIIAAITVLKISNTHIRFALGYNVFSYISFISALLDLITIYLVLIKKRFTMANNWFILFLGGATLMALGEGLQRASVFPEAALFWQNYSYIGLSLLPPMFYLFVVSYTSQYNRKLVLLSSVIILTWGVIAFFAGNGLIYVHSSSQIQHFSWGYGSDTATAASIIVPWSALFYILGTGLLLQFRKTNQDRLIKKQVSIFMFAFLLPFFAALITNVILPKVKPDVIPPLATFVGAFSGIFIYYGITHYRLFDLDPQLLAQNILDTMSEAVIIARPDSTIESINNEAVRMLGVSPEMATNQKIQTFFSDEDWHVIEEKIKSGQAAHGSQIISKSKVKNKEGNTIPVRVAVTSLIDGGQKTANIMVLSDITEITKSIDALQDSTNRIYHQNEQLTKLEAQLREEKAGVEHTVELRTKELLETQEKLKATDRLKTEFIMLTSHNLRTPLATVKGYLDMLTQYSVPDVVEKPLIDGLKVGIKRLDKFVEDLLAINSIESGNQLMLDEVPLDKVIEPLIQETNDLARTRKDKFVVNFLAGDVKIKCNIERLQGAIRNLLNNACKYTENGSIELSTNRSQNIVLINISDTGVGINESEIPMLFTKFHRGTDVYTSSDEGEGVGLYITKLIIDEHGGKLSVISKPGKGSTFTIELPCY